MSIWFAVLSVLVLFSGCMTESEQAQQAQQDKYDLRVYKQTKEGVKYYTTCAEGFLFVVTGAGHGNVMAGPIGKCKQALNK